MEKKGKKKATDIALRRATEQWSNQLVVLLPQKKIFMFLIPEILQAYSCENYGYLFHFVLVWVGFFFFISS